MLTDGSAVNREVIGMPLGRSVGRISDGKPEGSTPSRADERSPMMPVGTLIDKLGTDNDGVNVGTLSAILGKPRDGTDDGTLMETSGRESDGIDIDRPGKLRPGKGNDEGVGKPRVGTVKGGSVVKGTPSDVRLAKMPV